MRRIAFFAVSVYIRLHITVICNPIVQLIYRMYYLYYSTCHIYISLITHTHNIVQRRESIHCVATTCFCGIYSRVEGIDNEYLYKILLLTCAPCTNYLKIEYVHVLLAIYIILVSARQSERACCDVITSQHAME